MNSPLINILTRTSNRPNGFKRCHDSILNQTYKNIRHLVSYDNDKDLNYLKDIKDKYKANKDILLKEYKHPLNRAATFPYNLYINHLIKQVEEGWIMIIDDDDYLYDNNSIENLVKHINTKNKDTIFIFQAEYPTKRKIPDLGSYRIKRPRRGNISSCCFIFHESYRGKAHFPPVKAGDFDFINVLYSKYNSKIWIPEIFVKFGNLGGLGKRKDIK